MNLFDQFKKLLKSESQPQATESEPVKQRQLSPKEAATQRSEPWIQVINFELDPNNMSNGAIELDYNDIFVARLVKAGYRGKTDQQIVDQWFTDVCRNIVMETFEQEMADPEKRAATSTNRRNLGGGRSEFS
jgi:hypothetical protein